MPDFDATSSSSDARCTECAAKRPCTDKRKEFIIFLRAGWTVDPQTALASRVPRTYHRGN